MRTSYVNATRPLDGPAGLPRRRAGRVLRAAFLGVGVVVASLAVTAGVGGQQVDAAQGAMEPNTMAPVVTSSARAALDSYDEWVATGDAAAYRAYVWYRTQAAQFAATELGYSPVEMATAWAVTPIDHQRAVLAAMTQIGVPYRSNSSKEGVGFDCSGLTTYAWGRVGVTLERQSSAQIRNATGLDREMAKAGDLAQYPGHVMMYLGVGDAIIHSVQRGRTVELDLINERRVKSVRFGDPTV